MTEETRFQATAQVLALVKRAKEALASIRPNDLNASGVFFHPLMKLTALKAAREHIDKAIATIERKWTR
jgi:hypothetical protein